MTVTAVLVAMLVVLYAASITLDLTRRRLERDLRQQAARQRERRTRENPLRIRQRVLVNLRNGSAVAGVLWRRYDGQLILKDAVLHEQQQEIRVDGDVVIDRTMVTFVQVLPGADGGS